MARRDEFEQTGVASNVASPGFSFARTGNVNSGTYLLNGPNPSNVVPKSIFLTDPQLLAVSVNSSQSSTCVISVEEVNGAVFTEIATVTLTAQQSNESVFNLTLTKGNGLAVKIKSGSIKNPDVVLIISGNYE
jgi:hypothetical protein